MLGRRHARLALLALAALALLAADPQVLLVLAPALLVVALPLSGTFLGEDLIVARRTPRPVACRPARGRWAITRRLAPASLLERSPRTLRGPPVAA